MLPDAGRLDAASARALLALARAAVEGCFTGRAPALPAGDPALEAVRGVFVTLRRRADGALRGCLGHTQGRMPLAAAVRELAVGAALRDHRFAPVTADEVPGLSIELTVLSAPVPLARGDLPGAVEVGRHGLVVSRGERSGVLLPQVARGRGWDAVTFLEQVCRKAGLPPDAWREPGTRVARFEGESFGEGEGP